MESSLDFSFFLLSLMRFKFKFPSSFFSLPPKEKTDEASSSLFINQGSFLEGREGKRRGIFFPDLTPTKPTPTYTVMVYTVWNIREKARTKNIKKVSQV